MISAEHPRGKWANIWRGDFVQSTMHDYWCSVPYCRTRPDQGAYCKKHAVQVRAGEHPITDMALPGAPPMPDEMRSDYARVPWDRAACSERKRAVPGGWWNTGLYGERRVKRVVQLSYTAEVARAVCETCPIRPQCREYAVKWEGQPGIWAGLTHVERTAVRGRRYGGAYTVAGTAGADVPHRVPLA